MQDIDVVLDDLDCMGRVDIRGRRRECIVLDEFLGDIDNVFANGVDLVRR